MFKKVFLFIILSGFLLFNFSVVYGQNMTILPTPASKASCPPNYEGDNCGDYTVNDFLVLAVNVSRWILGIVGSLTLIMFIYGGVMFMISRGSSDSITKAKNIITAAVIGLLIVFTSFMIIKTVLFSMGIAWDGQQLEMKPSLPKANN